MKIVDSSRASFIIHYFEHFDNVKEAVKNIKLCGEDIEIIVVNDKPERMSEVNEFLTNRNHYQICSKDLHELRGYNNGIKLAHSDICILCQDDDIPPSNNKWFENCMQLFDDPKFGVLGLHYGSLLPWGQKGNEGHNSRLGLKYMHWLNFGPWFIRKSAAMECGLFSTEYSDVGEDCGGADSAMCAEMWLRGYKCALLSNKNTEQIVHHKGGRISFRNKKVKKRREERIKCNFQIYQKEYSSKFSQISNLVKSANQGV